MAERYSPVLLIIHQLSDITPAVSCISDVFYDHHVHSTSDISKIRNCLQNNCHTYTAWTCWMGQSIAFNCRQTYLNRVSISGKTRENQGKTQGILKWIPCGYPVPLMTGRPLELTLLIGQPTRRTIIFCQCPHQSGSRGSVHLGHQQGHMRHPPGETKVVGRP